MDVDIGAHRFGRTEANKVNIPLFFQQSDGIELYRKNCRRAKESNLIRVHLK